jgi:hypothetical protein
MRPRPAALLLVAAFLATVALPSIASAQDEAPEANGTSFPEPEESTQRGPRDNTPVSWFLSGIGIFAFVAVIGLFLLARRWGKL